MGLREMGRGGEADHHWANLRYSPLCHPCVPKTADVLQPTDIGSAVGLATSPLPREYVTCTTVKALISRQVLKPKHLTRRSEAGNTEDAAAFGLRQPPSHAFSSFPQTPFRISHLFLTRVGRLQGSLAHEKIPPSRTPLVP